MRQRILSITKKDFEISCFSGSGAGGQHRNKHQNCVRIRHPDSGVMVVSQEEKSKDRNMKKAFNRIVNHKSFKSWLDIEIAKAMQTQDDIESRIDKSMAPENLLIEYGATI